MLDIYHHPLRLRADPSRVVVRPFHLPAKAANGEQSRSERIVEHVLSLDEASVTAELSLVFKDFEARHWQTRKVFEGRYAQIRKSQELDDGKLSQGQKELIGAYFCHEYSYAAAALMNPSIVAHPDQTGLEAGSVRILMSLRAVGEGHISSIAFREGIVSANRDFELMPEPPFATAANSAVGNHDRSDEAPITIFRAEDSTLSGTVLFPITDAQRNGLEDLRLVTFTHPDGRRECLGTYTAYNGYAIRSELLRTRDFKSFDLVPMAGSAARNKGMALFPSAHDGVYRMIGRQDGENLFLIESDGLETWGEGKLLMKPKYPWEFVQIGNCGSPIDLPEGWLVLTHGVGAMRKYSIGAALLDKKDPSKVIGRTVQPILSAADEDREGYVPNVVYSCGGMVIGDDLFIPYGVADSSVAFAFLSIKELLNVM
ncbi:MAG: glycoside hydrolase family 130 protein [Sphingomonadaceae bacterium]